MEHTVEQPALTEEQEFLAQMGVLPAPITGTFWVRPCEMLEDGSGVTEANPDDAEFWGVYAEVEGGLSYWVSDHDTRELAEQEQGRLAKLYQATSGQVKEGAV